MAENRGDVSPLRIHKSNSTGSSSGKRPLQEISPMGVRRNSPSINQSAFKPVLDSSPFEASPVNNTSPRSFWKGQDSPSPTRIPRKSNENVAPQNNRRSSIERLQKASRVKNSSMFARENETLYSPDSSSVIDRPLAAGRPLANTAANTFSPSSANSSPSKVHGHRRGESSTKIPILSPSKANSPPEASTPSKTTHSPQKSSLSHRGNQADASADSDGTGSDDDGRGTPRPPKTVSFEQGPPQITLYEMITPDPSSVASGSREGSYDLDEFDPDESYEDDDEYRHEDSFDESLEDTAKTPVVLPEDWRFMSPKNANKDLAKTFDDPFGRHEAPSSPLADRDNDEGNISHSGSVNSDGDRRPLPPLPAKMNTAAESPRPGSNHSFSKPDFKPPRPASISKEDILGMRHDHMPLDERLRLLAIQQNKADGSERGLSLEPLESAVEGSPGPSVLDEDDEPTQKLHAPLISRESIMQKAKNLHDDNFENSELDSSPLRDARTYADFHPDEPVPSRETSSNYNADEIPGPAIKQEQEFEEDVNAHPVHYSSPDYGRDSSVIRHDVPEGTTFNFGFEQDSQYDPDEPIPSIEGDDVPQEDTARGSLPDFMAGEDFSFSFKEYMSPEPRTAPQVARADATMGEKTASPVSEASSALDTNPDDTSETVTNVKSDAPCEPDFLAEVATLETEEDVPAEQEARPATPTVPEVTYDEEEVPDTPESVIHHPIEYEYDESGFGEAPEEVPDEVATIRAPGGNLKTRESATCGDLEAIRDQAFGNSSDESRPGSGSSQGQSEAALAKADLNRRLSNRMKLELPLSEEDLESDLHEAFDKALEAKKRGYLMRQNTKVVVASNRLASGSSNEDAKDNTDPSKPAVPRKVSGKIVTTEPWNGKMRRQSSRRSFAGAVASKGAVPPLPGQDSNATALDAVNEEASLMEGDEATERGRLFVKVLGVKDLDLPLPKHERNWFQLTLDNGLHCVTTAWLELGRKAPIGQEFELTVFKELDFSLTLQTKLERPRSSAGSINSASPKPGKKDKGSTLSRFLQSPKKRREAEKKQQEEEAMAAALRQQEIEAARANKKPTSWDLLHDLVGPDGSFARSIVSLEEHEQQAFGKPYSVDVPCYNNWATDNTTNTPSTRSKHGGVQRKPPYKIGNLELQLLYIPKPKGIKDEDMPQSMSSAIRQLREAEANAAREHEGFLSQQGGDCPYWRRRFFRLCGSNLTSYHEQTRQRRANINLAKAVKLIDDRSALTQPDGMSKGGKSRRRSAFGEEEEGYMFVEEGFRIKFANGEIIDFYADNRADKEAWMRVLAEVVGKDVSPNKVSWTAAVLARRRLQGPVTLNSSSASQGGAGARSAPTSPVKNARPQSMIYDKPTPPLPGAKSPKRKGVAATTGRPSTPPKLTPTAWDGTSDARERRKNVRSMIF